MGAACCRCQQVAFEDDGLRFTAVSLNGNSLVAAIAASSAAASSSASSSSSVASATALASARTRRAQLQRIRSRVEGSRRHHMSHSLANYVAFPFPFASKVKARRLPLHPRGGGGTSKGGGKAKKRYAAPGGQLGDHWRVQSNGTLEPLTLMEYCIRNVCSSLLSEPDHRVAKAPGAVPSEVASAMLAYLKQHEALRKEQFHFLARFLYQEWRLENQTEVDSAWFDGIPVAPLQHIKSINLSNCHHVESFGSDRWLQVEELPSLTAVSFAGCTKLSKNLPDILQSSSRLMSLSLAGCRNIDDRSLLALRRLFRLKSLDLSGCGQVTDEGFKCLTGLSRMETLVLSRCTSLSDDSFEDVELAFPSLRHLDIAHCRLTDVALSHIGHIVTLTTLVIRGIRQVGDIGVERLGTLVSLEYFDARHCEEVRTLRPEWEQLRVLLLTRSAFSEAEAAILKNMTRIVELDVRSCRMLKRGFEIISKLVEVKRLTLAETALTDASLVQICKSIRGLVALDISHTEITDVGTEGLTYLEDLEVLRMDTTGITNRALANVSCLKNLKLLDIFGASVTDNGILHLTALRRLEELELCGGSITDRGVELISRIKSLCTLNLSQNRNINGKSLFCLQTLTKLRHLNLSNTSITAVSLRHLHTLKDLHTLCIYGCELSPTQVDMLQDVLPKLRCLRCS